MSRSNDMRLCATLFLALLSVELAGCVDRPLTTYLYGPAKSCYAYREPEKCDSIKPYDQVEIKVQENRQEITYIRKGLRLDESNTVFGRLENCKIIDSDTFSCDGLIRVGGEFVDTKIFGGLTVSTSYWIFAYSHYVDKSGTRRATVQRFDQYGSWITAGIALCTLFILIGLLSG